MARRDDLQIIGDGTFGKIRAKPFHYVAFKNDFEHRINCGPPPLKQPRPSIAAPSLACDSEGICTARGEDTV